MYQFWIICMLFLVLHAQDAGIEQENLKLQKSNRALLRAMTELTDAEQYVGGPSDNGYCSAGIASGNVCCSASCGTCGGSDCSGRPGGSVQCCSGPIIALDQECTTPTDTVCIIPDDKSGYQYELKGNKGTEIVTIIDGDFVTFEVALTTEWVYYVAENPTISITFENDDGWDRDVYFQSAIKTEVSHDNQVDWNCGEANEDQLRCNYLRTGFLAWPGEYTIEFKSGCGVISDYILLDQQACPGRNELGTFTKTATDCAVLCDDNEECVSFEVDSSGSDNNCRLSNSCKAAYTTSWDDQCVYEKINAEQYVSGTVGELSDNDWSNQFATCATYNGKSCSKCLKPCANQPERLCCYNTVTEADCSCLENNKWCGDVTDALTCADDWEKQFATCTTYNGNSCSTCLKPCANQPERLCCYNPVTEADCSCLENNKWCGDVTLTCSPTQQPTEMTEDICVDDPDWRNERDLDCETQIQKLVKQSKTCEGKQSLSKNCCASCRAIASGKATSETSLADSGIVSNIHGYDLYHILVYSFAGVGMLYLAYLMCKALCGTNKPIYVEI